MRKRVVILASGTGSLAQAILDASDLDIQVVAVVSDKADAQVLERAKQANINTSIIELKGDRQAWDRELFDQVKKYQPDLVVSAGFMKIDAGVDTGPIITQMEVPVLPGDDEATLHERIKKVERGLIVATIALITPTLESISR